MKTIESFYDDLKSAYFHGTPALASYHRMRIDTALDLISGWKRPALLFDFGCGSGELTEILERRGFSVSGCDVSAEMVASCNGKLKKGKVIKGGLEILSQAKADYLVSLNVLPYLSEGDEERFWRLAHKTLGPGGQVLVSHANLLFDLVTLNRYTVEFYKEKMIPALCVPERAEELAGKLEALLNGHDQPPRESPTWKGDGTVTKSEREVLIKRRVDPFEHPSFVEGFGFKMVGFQPINCFPLPPLILEAEEDLIIAGHRSHKLLSPALAKITCSQFQAVFRVMP